MLTVGVVDTGDNGVGHSRLQTTRRGRQPAGTRARRLAAHRTGCGNCSHCCLLTTSHGCTRCRPPALVLAVSRVPSPSPRIRPRALPLSVPRLHCAASPSWHLQVPGHRTSHGGVCRVDPAAHPVDAAFSLDSTSAYSAVVTRQRTVSPGLLAARCGGSCGKYTPQSTCPDTDAAGGLAAAAPAP